MTVEMFHIKGGYQDTTTKGNAWLQTEGKEMLRTTLLSQLIKPAYEGQGRSKDFLSKLTEVDNCANYVTAYPYASGKILHIQDLSTVMITTYSQMVLPQFICLYKHTDTHTHKKREGINRANVKNR